MRAILRARAWPSHLGLCSWFSNVYQKLLSANQWTFWTISVALQWGEQGTSSLPCAKSAEYFLHPVTVNFIVTTSPSQKQRTHPRYLSRQMSYDSSFFHSYSVSIGNIFGLSLAHQRLSNCHLPYFFIYVVASNTRKTLPCQLLSPYISSLALATLLQNFRVKIFL